MYLNEIFGAVADPTRRKILKLLSKKDLTAGDIGRHFDITAPSLSHHLAVLRQAGLVEQERDGRWLVYSLQAGSLKAAADQLKSVFAAPKK